MSEVGEDFKAFRELGRAKRQSNKEKSTELLKEHGIEFESRNDGVHLMIETSKGRVNFYPSTGLFNGALSGRGVFNLIEAFNAQERICGGLDHCKHCTMGTWRRAYCKRFERIINHDQKACIDWVSAESEGKDERN